MKANPLLSLVPGAGVEPARRLAPRDFKSNALLVQRVRGRSFWLDLEGDRLSSPLAQDRGE